MYYRSEIDGLRAIAVVPVILFHAGFEYFSGGFVGVDVFFVISGYLITGILIEDIGKDRFRIINFYERRARRILPALFFVMLCCIPFAWLWMLPDQLKDFSQSLVAVSLFSSNFLFWQESGYFSAVAEKKPLLHTWSLAVEEQYYLLFPLFLSLVWSLGKYRIFWLIFIFAVLSFLLSEWGGVHAPTANFYLAPTRAWELLMGSLAALIIRKYGFSNNNFLSLIGLLLIFFSIATYDKETPFPGRYALLPTLGTMLIILFANKETLVAKFLSTRLLVGIGLISYSAYLWHQPLFAFARIRISEHPGNILMLCLTITSIVFAVLSWKYVEQPFRNKKTSPRVIWLTSLSFLFLFIALGYSGHRFSSEIENDWLSKQTPERAHLYNLVKEASTIHENHLNNECRFNTTTLNQSTSRKLENCYQIFGKGILILGDSHAVDLFGMVTSRFDFPFIIGITKDGCRPHTPRPNCHYKNVLKFVSHNPDIFSHIIYEQAGFYLLKSESGKKGTREMFNRLPLDTKIGNITPNDIHIDATLKYLIELSSYVPTTWFLPRMEPHIDIHSVINKGCHYSWSFRGNSHKVFEKLDNKIEDLVENQSNINLKVMSQNKILNLKFPNDFMSCDSLYWRDGDHFSEKGRIRFGKRFPDEFLDF